MRPRISAAALMVNVMAAISSGRSTRASSARNRWMRSSVFPEPAGACTMHERAGSSARSRSPRSGSRAASFIAFASADRAEGRFLRHAAQHLLVARVARRRAALRIDARITRRVAAGFEPVHAIELHIDAGAAESHRLLFFRRDDGEGRAPRFQREPRTGEARQALAFELAETSAQRLGAVAADRDDRLVDRGAD